MKKICLLLVAACLVLGISSCAPRREHCPTFGKVNTINPARV